MLRRLLTCLAIALMAPLYFGAFLYNWAYRYAPGVADAEAGIGQSEQLYAAAAAEDAELDAQIARERAAAVYDEVYKANLPSDAASLAREAAQRCLAGADFSDVDVEHLTPAQRLWIACMNKQTARTLVSVSDTDLRRHLGGRICLGALPALMEVRQPVKKSRPQDYTPPRVHHLTDGEEWTYTPRVPC